MAHIDLRLPDDIQRQMAIPHCADLSLPQAKLPQIRLPTGGVIKGITDLTKGIPSDCSLTFSLAAQLAPIMASIECLVKVLKLIATVKEVLDGLSPPTPNGLLSAIPKIANAIKEVGPCLLVPTPLAMIPFVKDILLLLIAMLRCVIQQLRSVITLLVDIETQINDAHRHGNAELLTTLNCAHANARTAVGGVMQGLDPIRVLLGLADAFMKIAHVPTINIPVLDPNGDTKTLRQTLDTLQDVVDTMQQILDALP